MSLVQYEYEPRLESDKYGKVTLFSFNEDAEEALSKLQDIKHMRLTEPLTSLTEWQTSVTKFLMSHLKIMVIIGNAIRESP